MRSWTLHSRFAEIFSSEFQFLNFEAPVWSFKEALTFREFRGGEGFLAYILVDLVMRLSELGQSETLVSFHSLCERLNLVAIVLTLQWDLKLNPVAIAAVFQ